MGGRIDPYLRKLLLLDARREGGAAGRVGDGGMSEVLLPIISGEELLVDWRGDDVRRGRGGLSIMALLPLLLSSVLSGMIGVVVGSAVVSVGIWGIWTDEPPLTSSISSPPPLSMLALVARTALMMLYVVVAAAVTEQN